MRAPEPVAGTPLVPGVRVLLLAFAVLTLAAANQLFVLAPHTAAGWAWPIRPPLTAAFLGAGYASGLVLSVLSLRRGTWEAARVGFLTVWLFTAVALAATLLHLDRFSFGADALLPRFAAWVWLVVYVVVPVAMGLALRAQLRVPGAPAHPGPSPGPVLRAALLVQAAVLGLTGAALFALPAARQAWPWELTPLTARSIASWLLALALAAVLVARDGDLVRLRPAAVTYTVLGVLQLAALARFPGDVDWSRPAAWVYPAVLLSVLAVGVAGLTTGRAARRAGAARPAQPSAARGG
ncbi:hypothetical protein NUM3379_39240 [Kineococcus sp. NUM-3379]